MYVTRYSLTITEYGVLRRTSWTVFFMLCKRLVVSRHRNCNTRHTHLHTYPWGLAAPHGLPLITDPCHSTGPYTGNRSLASLGTADLLDTDIDSPDSSCKDTSIPDGVRARQFNARRRIGTTFSGERLGRSPLETPAANVCVIEISPRTCPGGYPFGCSAVTLAGPNCAYVATKFGAVAQEQTSSGASPMKKSMTKLVSVGNRSTKTVIDH
jgi:hypothetical protein